jgi:hypothetical protein
MSTSESRELPEAFSVRGLQASLYSERNWFSGR